MFKIIVIICLLNVAVYSQDKAALTTEKTKPSTKATTKATTRPTKPTTRPTKATKPPTKETKPPKGTKPSERTQPPKGAQLPKETGEPPNITEKGETVTSKGSHCEPGRYGGKCQLECHCNKEKACTRSTGACKFGCALGYHGPGCRFPCKFGKFGANCSRSCNCLEYFGSCAVDTGFCTAGCGRGYTGEFCNDECPDYKFGADCKRKCNCKDGKLCDKKTGRCEHGCYPLYHGIGCNIWCKAYTFGIECTPCRCLNTWEACHLKRGKCSSGCIDGWEGPTCQRAIDPLKYLHMSTRRKVGLGLMYFGITVIILSLGAVAVFYIRNRKKHDYLTDQLSHGALVDIVKDRKRRDSAASAELIPSREIGTQEVIQESETAEASGKSPALGTENKPNMENEFNIETDVDGTGNEGDNSLQEYMKKLTKNEAETDSPAKVDDIGIVEDGNAGAEKVKKERNTMEDGEKNYDSGHPSFCVCPVCLINLVTPDYKKK